MSKDKRSNYEVGYGKPPADQRFAKGRSGNPKGRPKKSPPIRTGDERINMIREESERLVPVMENGERVEMSVERAIIRSTLAQAITKGTPQALRISYALLAELSEKDRSSFIPGEEELRKLGPIEIVEVYKRIMGGE